jgi:hypothetical protein
VNEDGVPYSDELEMQEAPLAGVPLERARPPRAVLEEIMEQMKTGRGLQAPAGGG